MNDQLKENSFFKNEKFEKTTPKDAKMVAEEFCNFIEKNLT